ncbi:MAG: DUF2252 domain-containing protein [Planctomycetes bacterium]|nr:DUF2252 domain-containing protein [Planctomycetota bacterium]
MHFRDLLLSMILASGCAAAPPLPDPARRRAVVDAIAGADAALSPDDREARHARLAASAHAFFRGTPERFWRDLGGDPRLERYGGEASRAWVVGDAHVENFGCQENARREVVYDINDFDEVVVADVQLDLWRLATSVVLTLREQGDLDAAEQREVVEVLARAYLAALERLGDGDAAREHRLTAREAYGLLDDLLIETESGEGRGKLLDRWTATRDGRPVLDTGRADLAAAPELEAALRAAWPGYLASVDAAPFPPGYFAVKSVARRLGAGTASLGVARCYVLVEGPTSSPGDDRILDVKEQRAPAGPAPEGLAPEERVVAGARALAPLGDPHLGHLRAGGRGFTVLERSPYRGRLDARALTTVRRAREVAEQWAGLLAAAHARGAGARAPALLRRARADAVGFAALVLEVALEQADAAAADHAAFVAWRAGAGPRG